MINLGQLYEALKKTAAKYGVRGVNAFAHKVEPDGGHTITLSLKKEDVEPPAPPRPKVEGMSLGASTPGMDPSPPWKRRG